MEEDGSKDKRVGHPPMKMTTDILMDPELSLFFPPSKVRKENLIIATTTQPIHPNVIISTSTRLTSKTTRADLYP
jgi:hypothetical protein